MSERLFEYPETVINTLPRLEELPESTIQIHPGQLRLQVGAFATAVAKGQIEGLIGSDIFPEEEEGY